MRKFYQSEWFGIRFDTFSKMRHRSIADVEFYDKFYDKFNEKFSRYDDLPPEWLSEKMLIANFIKERSCGASKLLSIGSGIGFIEYCLNKSGVDVTAIEPSEKAGQLLKIYSNVSVYNGFFPSCLENVCPIPDFDYIYMTAVDYCFDDPGLRELLKRIKARNAENFLLISAMPAGKQKRIFDVKDSIKSILASFHLAQYGQFWGYQRTPEELSSKFKEAGFTGIERGFLSQRVFWINGR